MYCLFPSRSSRCLRAFARILFHDSNIEAHARATASRLNPWIGGFCVLCSHRRRGRYRYRDRSDSSGSNKASYWRWPERNLAGNATDFYMVVLGLTFHEAMKEITEGCTLPAHAKRPLPS